jgi:aminobenzoyl-glutamate transport protein
VPRGTRCSGIIGPNKMRGGNVSQRTGVQRFLDVVEAVGNRLPHPAILFMVLVAALLLLTALLSALGVVVQTPTGRFPINNLIGADPVQLQNPRNGAVTATFANGWQYLADTLTPNFIRFAPFGLVIVIMLAIGVAEHSGLVAAAVRKAVLAAPRSLVTPVVVFAGVMSNIAADAGYLVLVPLGAIVFLGMGRHPLAGLAAAFVGVSGGFSANLVITSLDPLLGGFTLAAARTGDALVGTHFSETMNIATMNYYFVVASTFLVVLVGTVLVDRVVEPRLGVYTPGDAVAPDVHPGDLTAAENRGLRWAGFALLAYLAVLVLMVWPVQSGWPLVGSLSTATLPAAQQAALVARHGSVGFTHAPVFGTEIIVTVLFFLFLVPGLAYGWATGTIRKGVDLVRTMEESMRGMASFIVLVFFMAQFVAYFNASNVGVLIAMQGASLLESLPHESTLGTFALIVGFVLLSGFINLFMGSASAKWAILAPIFVPVMMTVGVTPAATQMLYRIGDSSTNIITPLMTFFALVITVGQKYRKDFGVGSLVSLMLPFSIALMIAWMVLFLAWAALGWPLGPNTPIFFTPPR